MSIVVGTLTIDLAANTASFASSMDKMSQLSARTANDIKRSLEKITAAGLAMAGAIAGATVAVVKGALDSADELGKMAQAAGTTSETLSTLSYAAKLSNVENEQLVKGLEKLSLASFKAQNGNVQLQRIFGRVGVSVRDSNGALKDSGTLMEELAVKFAAMGDGAGKTALAQAVFGKSGAALIPFLNQYGSEQEKVNDEAHRFGLVLSTSTVEVAARAHDSLEKLQAILKGMGFSLLSATLPALDELLNKLIDIAQHANLQNLAKGFGGEVVNAVHALGDSLDFATEHAAALKHALEALIALKLAAIAIPALGDLSKGGAGNVGKGLDKFTVGFLGLEKVLPVLSQFAGWLRTEITFVGLLASEEGIASAATYVLGGTIAAMGGPIGVAVAAIAGLGIALYKFRDATISVRGQTYELRDFWAAAWLQMKDALAPVGTFFSKLMADIKNLWTGMVDWIKQNSVAKSIVDDIGKATSWVKQHSPSLVTDEDVSLLNRARDQRLSKNYTEGYTTGGNHPEHQDFGPGTKPPPDTSGLGKPQKDIFGDEVRKLNLAIEQEKAYLAVLDGTPEKLAEVAAAEKARGIIVELNNRLTDEGRAKLTAHQEAIIGEKVATELSLKALDDYGKELVSQQHATDLSIQQTRALAAANLEGDAAIRRTAVDNVILGLTFNRTAEQIRAMTPELTKLRELLTAKASADLVAGTNKEIDGLRDELTERQMVNAATLASIDVQRQASLASKLYPLNQNIREQPIATADDRAALAALEAKRDALVQVAQAEWAAADAQAALSLRSPTEQYRQEVDALNHAVAALEGLQGGSLSYGQQVQVAARQQDEFNKATDDTIALMLREGSAADGVTAFFLEMQKQGKSAAATLYEAFNSAFSKISQGFTGVLTSKNRWQRAEAWGQFGQMFDDLGKQLLNSTINKGLQSGLGSLGKLFGINLAGVGAKIDGSTESQALWVRLASGTPGLGGKSSIIPGLAGLASGSSAGQSWLSRLTGGLFGGSAQSRGSSSAPEAAVSLPLGGQGSSGAGIFSSILSALGGAANAGKGAEGGNGSDGESGSGDFFSSIFSSLGGSAESGSAESASANAGGGSFLDKLAAFAPPVGSSAPYTAADLSMMSPGDADALSTGAPPPQRAPLVTMTRPKQSGIGDLVQSLVGTGLKLIPGFAGGGHLSGHVSGPGTGTSDSIPARLSHGEFVVKAAAAAKHLSLLHAINGDDGAARRFRFGGLAGYAAGGLVAASLMSPGAMSPGSAYLQGAGSAGAMSSVSGAIANMSSQSSSSASAGDTHNWNIDARGATDPAAVEAAVNRSIAKAAPMIARMGMQGTREQRLRAPTTSR